jgi:hypothetical protein
MSTKLDGRSKRLGPACTVNSGAPQAPDSIDFELTDFDQARAALEEPPAGVKTVQRDAKKEWSSRRRAVDSRDLGLTALAVSWLDGLPHEVRPTELPRMYPRIANQLAEAWNDIDACLAMLGDLIVDRRGDRRGFSSRIALELVAVRDHRGAIDRLRR